MMSKVVEDFELMILIIASIAAMDFWGDAQVIVLFDGFRYSPSHVKKNSMLCTIHLLCASSRLTIQRGGLSWLIPADLCSLYVRIFRIFTPDSGCWEFTYEMESGATEVVLLMLNPPLAHLGTDCYMSFASDIEYRRGTITMGLVT